MTKADLDERLKLIGQHAKALREAGVLSVTIGDIQFELQPPEPSVGESTFDDDDEQQERPLLKDKDLFGGSVPRRRGQEPDEDD